METGLAIALALSVSPEYTRSFNRIKNHPGCSSDRDTFRLRWHCNGASGTNRGVCISLGALQQGALQRGVQLKPEATYDTLSHVVSAMWLTHICVWAGRS